MRKKDIKTKSKCDLWNYLRAKCPVSIHDFRVTVFIMCAAMVLCAAFRNFAKTDLHIALLFELAVVLVSRYTNGFLYGILASIMGVVCINYVFTYPYFALDFTISGYPLTFTVMLAVTIIVSALTTQIKMQEKLRMEVETEKMRSNLLRAVSHDIRTPLTSIMGASNAILENGDNISPETCQELLQDIYNEAEWLVGAVENLLSVTRITDDETKLKKNLEAAEEIISAAVMKMQKRFPKIKISVKIPKELLLVPMDPILIEQVLINLMENAVSHGQTTTWIGVSLFKQDDKAIFEIEDNGMGIPNDTLPRLFSGYFSHAEENDCQAKRNMGIGLSVCMTIIKAHGGDMMAYNRRNGGAALQFTLPLEDKKS